MKICLLIPFFSTFSFLSILSPGSYIYLSPWLDVNESIAMGSFFLLLCEYVSENRTERDMFFATLVITVKKTQNGKKGGLPWYRVSSLSIMFVEQYINTMLATMVQDISISCRFPFNSYSYKHNSSCRCLLPVWN